MRLKITKHEVVGDNILIAGYVDRKSNPFSDVSVPVDGLVEFVRENYPEYALLYSAEESMDIDEELYSTPIFNEDRMLEEIDYEILAEYVLEINLIEK